MPRIEVKTKDSSTRTLSELKKMVSEREQGVEEKRAKLKRLQKMIADEKSLGERIDKAKEALFFLMSEKLRFGEAVSFDLYSTIIIDEIEALEPGYKKTL